MLIYFQYVLLAFQIVYVNIHKINDMMTENTIGNDLDGRPLGIF